ncbi:MAG: sugar phosphate isomerase/epimerase [Armatimonadetes bacterium]|nr:sugar phosphate isomerase/epimerase [Armatimonadota bacterium]MDE2208059.1 sugar phosphate isomerase/epimerase [Armatimonadota bacterium]
MKTAICNETFEHWRWDDTLDAITAAGYDGVEIAPFTFASEPAEITADDRASIATAARRRGLQIAGLHWLLVSPPGLSLTSDDTEVRVRTVRHLAALVELCADLGGAIMVLGSPAQRRIPAGLNTAGATLRVVEALASVAPEAEKRGITICLEPLPAPEADLILTLHEAVDAIAQVASPNLRTLIDVKSASAESTDVAAAVRTWAPWVAHFHANDTNMRGPGTGDTDYVPIMAALHEIGYAGWVSVEVFNYEPDPVTIARESISYVRRCNEAAMRSQRA